MAKTLSKPLISVIMPVYNAANFLPQAIESILSQTYRNFEFIIVDDASTDNSWKIIKHYSSIDKRIIALKNQINFGVSLTSNIAINKAKGKYLVRMDADDISFSNRLEKEYNFLENHPKYIAVGGQCVLIDEYNNNIGIKKFPTDTEKIKEMIFWAVPVQQPTMMVNLSNLPKNFVWYSPNRTSAEEIDLFFRFMKLGKIANIEDEVLFYRQLSNSLSHKNPKATFDLTIQSRINGIRLGFVPTFKAIILNICQIVAISILPAGLINEIWSHIRGMKPVSKQSKIESMVIAGIKSN